MPELPESDAARRRIADQCLNRTIEGFDLGEVSHVELPSKAERDRLVGTQFSTTRRHGKYIFAGTKGGPWLHVHLGMSGSLRVWEEGEAEPDFARLTIRFEGGRRLSFHDPRKFGVLALVEDVDAFIEDKGLGPDAMQIGDNAFADVIGSTRGAIKSALLLQSKLAGIGNLWSDETLYRCGVLPDARACDLEAATISHLHRAMQDIMGLVMDKNADYSQLPQDWLIHHREAGAACPRCGGTIAKKTVGGRTAYHCPEHQTGA
ncbi:Fpg/Nei family DNA glycosylase [Salipiger sp. IMCC34102]|uniref:Fpg/Nei family DNA glycosylase n=1 Tax=Salipiger sp. IMCC34102 TaxID=2510647 RepID=UPI00101BBA6A|nr:DNA-formamidopyrimidine glycosylase family protein [Salipiger sp. IMCC34102]RYH04318.1 Fpg/Nei family DNA glycosylase [Salipiger sp. IMCC34102]